MQTNFKFRTTQSQLRKRVQDELEKEMTVWLQQETDQMVRKLGDLQLRKADDIFSVKSLSGKDPVQILVAVYDTCMPYMKPRQKQMMTDFFQWAIRDQTVRRLLLLSIYKGAYAADKLMPSFFEESQSLGTMSEACPQQQQQMLYKSEGKPMSQAVCISSCVSG